ncbi:MAG: 30S ribosomal protein S4 [Patescibacteria group bacterium]
MSLKQPSCKQCRREGEKLFLKGTRCHSQKCAIIRKNYIPGQGGASRRSKLTSYGIQLREKQKAKRIYGIREKQFYGYYSDAAKKKGVTGLVLLQFLETRLDNIVYRLGWAPSRKLARQLVSHSQVQVNGQTINIASYPLKIGDKITVKSKARDNKYFQNEVNLHDYKAPVWLKANPTEMSGEIVALPSKDDIEANINEQLIIEFYSR